MSDNNNCTNYLTHEDSHNRLIQLNKELQTKDDEIEKLKNQLVNILYQTEVFKPIAIANTLRQFLRLNVPDYKERRQETLKEAE